MDDIYKNIEEYNRNKKRETLMAFDDMTADMLSNKKLSPIVTELFIRGRKLYIFLAFITQSYFSVPKSIRLNSTHYFIKKIPNKRELQQIAFNDSWDIDFRDFMNLYKKCTAKPYSFLVNDATLASDIPSRFRGNVSERIWKGNSWQLITRLELKKCNMILTEKQQKYQHYYLEKLINMNILQVKKYCLLIKDK